LTASNESLSRTTTSFTSDQNTLIEVPKKSYEVFKIVSKEYSYTNSASGERARSTDYSMIE